MTYVISPALVLVTFNDSFGFCVDMVVLENSFMMVCPSSVAVYLNFRLYLVFGNMSFNSYLVLFAFRYITSTFI